MTVAKETANAATVRAPVRPAAKPEPAPKARAAALPVTPVSAAPVKSQTTAANRAAELSDGWRTDAGEGAEKCKYCHRDAVAHERCAKHAEL